MGEKYIRKFRGISGKIPEDFKFMAKCKHGQLNGFHPAIIVPSKNQKGTIVALNRIFLGKDGNNLKVQTQDGKKIDTKIGIGAVKHGSISIQKNKQSGVCFITEGTEDALAIKQVNQKDNIKCNIGLSQMKNIKFEPHIKTVIIGADNDGFHPDSKAALTRTIQGFLDKGLTVKLAVPEPHKLDAKTDLNDVLKRGGGERLSQVLNDTIIIRDVAQMGEKNEPIGATFNRVQSGKVKVQSATANNNASVDKFNANQRIKTQVIQRQINTLER